MKMFTIDRMKSLDDFNHEQVENYREGEKFAIAYFKGIHEESESEVDWDDDMVSFYGPKKFRTYDEENNVTIETTVYESYVDSGGEDYFFFSYKTEL